MKGGSLGLPPSHKPIPLIILLSHVEYLGVATAQPILDHNLIFFLNASVFKLVFGLFQNSVVVMM